MSFAAAWVVPGAPKPVKPKKVKKVKAPKGYVTAKAVK